MKHDGFSVSRNAPAIETLVAASVFSWGLNAMPDVHTEQQYVDELAEYDNRKLILWQLAADGRDFVGVEHVAREYSKEDAPVPEQVRAFVDDMIDDGEIRGEYDEGTDWDALEETHGKQADKVLCQ